MPSLSVAVPGAQSVQLAAPGRDQLPGELHVKVREKSDKGK